jgi:hypothetical protein
MTKLLVTIWIVSAIAWLPAIVAFGPWAGCGILALSLASLALAGASA